MIIHKVATVYDLDLKQLPEQFRSVLTRQEVKALRTGPKYFATLAGPDSPEWLQRVVRECSESDFTLKFETWDDNPFTPHFQFLCEGFPDLTLPRTKKIRSDVPEFLRRIYKVVGSFEVHDFNLGPANSLGLVSDSWLGVVPDSAIDPKTAVPFLETSSGKYLCYLTDGGGAWLESAEFRRVENLEHEVAQYFEALSEGTQD